MDPLEFITGRSSPDWPGTVPSSFCLSTVEVGKRFEDGIRQKVSLRLSPRAGMFTTVECHGTETTRLDKVALHERKQGYDI